jgi:hypothetical protein
VSDGIRQRGEEAVGDLAQTLLENPLFAQALGKALGAGERAAQAQRAALGAIDVPSAGDVERLNRRVRALSDRIEALEDAVDRIERSTRAANAPAKSSSKSSAKSSKPSKSSKAAGSTSS